MQELQAYESLGAEQGNLIPYLYGRLVSLGYGWHCLALELLDGQRLDNYAAQNLTAARAPEA